MSTVYRLKLAEIPFELVCVSDGHHASFDKYRTSDEPLFSVTTDENRLNKMKLENDARCIAMGFEPFEDYIRYAERYMLVSLLKSKLLDYGVFTLHGSALSLDGNGYVFTAHSGTGKSTHAAIWRETFGDRCEMINDDSPLIRRTDGVLRVYGSPFSGKHQLDNNTSVPLKVIAQIVRSETTFVKRCSPQEAFPVLIEQFFGKFTAGELAKVAAMAKEMIEEVSFYRLFCNTGRDAAEKALAGFITT